MFTKNKGMATINELSIDIETYSSTDLTKSGVYRYAESPDFEVLLFAYSADGEEVHVIDLACGEQLPQEIHGALLNPAVKKWAYNAQFERVCLSHYLGIWLNPDSWYCDMVWAASMGLPLSLEGAGAVLELKDQKLKEGKDLIRYFTVPCKPTKANGNRNRNHPLDDPFRWETFKAYNKRDVETELQIHQRLSCFPVPDNEWKNYHLDQSINDRGVGLDMTLVSQAIECDEQYRKTHLSQAKEITGLENPNSTQQLKDWLAEQGMETDSLSKATVAEMLESADGNAKAALELRQELAKSSVKKYTAMQSAVCRDGRARGLIQFYGAGRTGRYSGRLIQVQNLPQNHLPDLEQARSLIRDGQFDTVELLYDSVPSVLSELIRTAFVPKKGNRFFVADYSAIEARVIAWLAGEKWRLEAFEKGEDIYCQAASQMFGVPVVKNGVNGHLRQKGKIAELACIAEGQLVLTDRGLVPIEQITKKDLLWDGESWVSHGGLVFRGVRVVIEYEGLVATPDHFVLVEGKEEPIHLGEAANTGFHLLQTGDVTESSSTKPVYRGFSPVFDIRNVGRHHRFTVSGRLVHNCGYGGSVGALTAMGALSMGLKQAELQPLVSSWREASPHIVQFWWDVDKAATSVIEGKTRQSMHGIIFECTKGMLFITLPSGRKLAYVKPQIGVNKFGIPAITFEGTGAAKRWERIETYGPKLVENIVQATSRDLLAEAMCRLEAKGYPIVMHIHDEVVLDAAPETNLKEICRVMAEQPDWAKGLPLRADGYVCDFYKKD